MAHIFHGLLAAGLLILAYYINNPLPEGIEEPYWLKLKISIMRLMEDATKVAEYFGLSDKRIAMRRLLDAMFSPPAISGNDVNGLHITNTTFNGVNVWLFSPHNENTGSLLKGVMFVHGGGFMVGSVGMYHDLLSKIARETGVVVMAPEYRLSPEYPVPAAMEDCLAASRYFFAHAHELGVDPKRIGVGGDSAGGNMAAVLSLRYRDEGAENQFAYQVLLYPWMQAIDFRLPSYLQNDKYMAPDMKQYGMVLYTISYIGIDRKYIPQFMKNQHVSKSTRTFYSKSYKIEALPGYNLLEKEDEAYVDEDLAKEVEPLITNPYNFPLMAKSLQNVPPALVLTVGMDTIRDDGLLYLQRLRDAGVEVEHYHDNNCWHAAFSSATGENPFSCSIRLFNSITDYIKRQN